MISAWMIMKSDWKELKRRFVIPTTMSRLIRPAKSARL
jgi:hypothetical protein